MNIAITARDLARRFGQKYAVAGIDLDDVVVEEVKLDLMRRIPRAPMQAGIEIRLIGMDDDLRIRVCPKLMPRGFQITPQF